MPDQTKPICKDFKIVIITKQLDVIIVSIIWFNQFFSILTASKPELMVQSRMILN